MTNLFAHKNREAKLSLPLCSLFKLVIYIFMFTALSSLGATVV